MEFIASAIIPLVVSFFKNPAWDVRFKFALAFVLSVAVGAAFTFVDGGFTVATLAANSGKILGYSQAFYVLLIRQSGLNARLESAIYTQQEVVVE